MFSFKQCFEGLWEVWFRSACTCHNTIQWFIRSYVPVFLFVFWFLFFSCVGFSWSLGLQSEAETLLAGSLGLCLTMHNWALLLAYSHGCTLFSWNGQECKLPPPPLQPAFPGGPQSDTKCTRPAYQRGQAWHGLTLNGTFTEKCVHVRTHAHKWTWSQGSGVNSVWI